MHSAQDPSLKEDISLKQQSQLPALFGLKIIKDEDIEALRQRCSQSMKGRTRICMHDSKESPLHVMLIAISAGHYIGPHISRCNGELLYIIHTGRVLIGAERSEVVLGDGGVKSLMIDKTKSRTIENLHSGISLYWEIHIGPHMVGDTIWVDTQTLEKR